jgi:riboflavin kinase/FMN adenylyltransferase
VHDGHKQILNKLIEAAKEIQGESVVMTFHPHPRTVLYPEDSDLRLLHTLDEKLAHLDKLGVDKTLVIPFTLEFSRIPSDQYIKSILVDIIGAKRIIIGYDHRFGRNRTGGLQELRLSAPSLGFTVDEISAHQIDNANVSSTKIRNALNTGDVSKANMLLGYNYSVTGKVIKGKQLGRQIGYPTANIQPNDELKLIPGKGVYVVAVGLNNDASKDAKTIYAGMMNIGIRPTFGGDAITLEVHILDFEGDVYDKDITVYFVEKLRDEQRFSDIHTLKEQLNQDLEITKEIWNNKKGEIIY